MQQLSEENITHTERVLGVDLLTTNSAAAIMEVGRPLIITSVEGPSVARKMFPSAVAFTKDDQLVGGSSRACTSKDFERIKTKSEELTGDKPKEKVVDSEYERDKEKTIIASLNLS